MCMRSNPRAAYIKQQYQRAKATVIMFLRCVVKLVELILTCACWLRDKWLALKRTYYRKMIVLVPPGDVTSYVSKMAESFERMDIVFELRRDGQSTHTVTKPHIICHSYMDILSEWDLYDDSAPYEIFVVDRLRFKLPEHVCFASVAFIKSNIIHARKKLNPIPDNVDFVLMQKVCDFISNKI